MVDTLQKIEVAPNSKVSKELPIWNVPITLNDGSTVELEMESDVEPTQSDVFNMLEQKYNEDPQSDLGKLHQMTLGEGFSYTTPGNADDASMFKLSNEDGNKKVDYNSNKELVRNIVNTFTLEFGDELEAGVRSLVSDRSYDDIVNQLRAQQSQYRLDKPGEAIIASILTGVVTGTGALKLLQKSPAAYKWFLGAKDAPLGKRILAMMRGGGTTGAVTGLGAASEDDSLAGSTAMYSGAGAIIPAVLIGGGAGVKKSVGMINNILKNTGIKEGNPDKEAFEYIASTLANQGKTPEEIQSKLLEVKKLGVNDPQFAELTSGFKQLSKQALNVPSASNDLIEEAVGQRKTDMTDILQQSIVKKMNLKGSNFTDDYASELAEKQALKARELYPEAESKTIPKSAFDTTVNGKPYNYLESDLAKDAYNRYRTEASKRLSPEKLPTYEELMKMEEIPTYFLTKIKRGIRRIVDDQVDTTTGKFKTDYGPQLKQDLKKFDDIIRTNNTQYAEANDKFADYAKMKDIYQKGFDYQKMNTREFENYLKQLDPDQKEAFKVGILNKISDIAETMPENADFTQRVFKNKRMKDAFKNVFDDEKSYKEFTDLVDFAHSRKKTTQTLFGGSPTQPLQVQKDVFDQIAEKGPTGIISTLKEVTGMSPAVAENVKRILVNATPEEQKAIIKSLLDSQNKYKTKKVVSDYSKAAIKGQARVFPTAFEGLLSGPPEEKEEFRGIL